MKKRRLKKPILYGLYVVSFLLVFTSVYLLERSLSPTSFNDDDNQTYVDKTIFEQEIPVIKTEDIIIRPYTDNSIKIIKNYYDYQGEANEQQNALIYHENTYLQNSGIAYGGKENFEVVSILDGEIISVKEDDLLGKIVEIRHNNDIVSIYQSLSEISVKEKDEVKQGKIIGKSGNSNISKDLNDHLHFELIIKGQIVNPENYYDKKIGEI